MQGPFSDVLEVWRPNLRVYFVFDAPAPALTEIV
jgi:hypothetical protein